jgi:hypothetical protein
MSDLHTHFRQHHHRRDEDDDNKQNIAKDRQERAQPRPPSRLFGVWQTRIGAVSELAIDRRFYGVPQEIGAEQDDNGAQHTMDDPGQPRVLRGEVNEVDTPPPGEHRPAPMIKSARMPRSRTTVTTLGGPSAISCEPPIDILHEHAHASRK